MSSFDGEDPSSLRRRIVPKATERKRLRFQVRPVLRGQLGRMLAGFAAFEVGNVAATLLILRATDLLIPGQASTQQRGPLLVTAPGVFRVAT